MKKQFNQWRLGKPLLKFDLKMKLTTLLLFTTLLGLKANDSYAQKTKVTLDIENATVRDIIDDIESVTDFRFVYKTRDVDLQRKLSLRANRENINKVLAIIFGNTNTKYKVRDTQIILTRNQNLTTPIEVPKQAYIDNVPDQIQVSGQVIDENGTPLTGANILEKGTTNGTQADFDGNFSLDLNDDNAVLVVSYIGFATKEVSVNGQTNISVIMEESAVGMDEVVVVGFGTQKKN